MKKITTIALLILAFIVVVYVLETGEKDPTVTASEAPSDVKGR